MGARRGRRPSLCPQGGCRYSPDDGDIPHDDAVFSALRGVSGAGHVWIFLLGNRNLSPAKWGIPLLTTGELLLVW